MVIKVQQCGYEIHECGYDGLRVIMTVQECGWFLSALLRFMSVVGC